MVLSPFRFPAFRQRYVAEVLPGQDNLLIRKSLVGSWTLLEVLAWQGAGA